MGRMYWLGVGLAVASGVLFNLGSLIQKLAVVGDASKLIPIQNVPAQILPVAAYFLVFQLQPENPLSLPLCLLGVVLVLFGAALLAGRQELQVGTLRNP